MQTHLSVLVEQAKTLINESDEHVTNGRWSEARDSALQCIAVLDRFHEVDEQTLEAESESVRRDLWTVLAKSHLRLGTIAQQSEEYHSAKESFERSLPFAERTKQNSLIASLMYRLGEVNSRLSQHTEALHNLQKAFNAYTQDGNSQGVANALNRMGACYFFLGNLSNALEAFSAALAKFEELQLETSATGAMVNIGSVYVGLEMEDKALEYYERALVVLERIGDLPYRSVVTHNMVGVYITRKDFHKALEYSRQALGLSEELQSRSSIAGSLTNVGLCYKKLGMYDEAMEYYHRSLTLHEEIGDIAGTGTAYGNLGSLYAMQDFRGYNPDLAEQYLLKSIELCEAVGVKTNLYDNELALSELYETLQRWQESALHFKRYHTLKEETQSNAARQQAQRFELQRQMHEREQQLVVERTRASATQDLLHKVLPGSIADRLVLGERIADYFQNVSILFADIVGFTPIASRMPAKAVLAFLNFVFGEFDRMVAATGCEKIKTIGDGYLAVAGAPISCEDHAERIARLAFEMMKDIVLPEEIRKTLPKGAQFSLRIGIHTGPCFGGIVGENRFVYDLYSDAVNTAARMESHGEAGKIHVSDDFCFHLQNRIDTTGVDLGTIRFEEREEIEVKGKGTMRTYFLEKA